MRDALATPQVLALAFVVVSCGSSDQPSVASEPATWTVGAAPIAEIGQVDGDPEYLFSRISHAKLLPDGRVAVVDNADATIRVFSADGLFDHAFGGEGEGPGEFAYISGIQVSPPDTIVAHDSQLLRLSRFLTSGSLIATVPLRAEDGLPEIYLGAYSNGELGFAWIRQGPRSGEDVTPDEMRIARFDESGHMNAMLGTETGMLRTGSSPLAFSPHLYTELIHDSVYITNGLRPEIQVWDHEGNLARTITIPIQPLDPTVAWTELETELLARDDRFELQWFENQPRDVSLPFIAMMLVDDQDRLWIKKYNPRTDSHLLRTGRARGGDWLILETSGAIVASVHLPDGFLLLDIGKDRLLGKVRDGLGVETLQVYGIAE